MRRTLRDHIRPVIADILRETASLPEASIRKALFEAYPFGERAMHPYKIWRDEIRVQRGLKAVKRRGSGQETDLAQEVLF